MGAPAHPHSRRSPGAFSCRFGPAARAVRHTPANTVVPRSIPAAAGLYPSSKKSRLMPPAGTCPVVPESNRSAKIRFSRRKINNLCEYVLINHCRNQALALISFRPAPTSRHTTGTLSRLSENDASGLRLPGQRRPRTSGRILAARLPITPYAAVDASVDTLTRQAAGRCYISNERRRPSISGSRQHSLLRMGRCIHRRSHAGTAHLQYMRMDHRGRDV